MAENGMSAADIAAVTRPNWDGYGHGYGYGFGNAAGGDLVWIILLFALFGMGGGGFGWGNGFGNIGNVTTDSGLLGYALGNNATKNDLSDGLNSVQLMGKLDNLNNAVVGGFDGVQMQLCQGFNSTQRQILEGDNATQRELLQGFNTQNVLGLQNTAAIQQSLSNNRYADQQCCCEIKTAIANSDNLNFRNTCDIVNAIQQDGEKTREFLVTNKIADLEEKLAERARELQTAQIEASQQAQTNALISALRPSPIPAYATCSPYMSNYYAVNGNCGCGV